MKDELLGIVRDFTRQLSQCQEGCGRPATRQAEGDCFECGHYGNLFCDKCDVSLANRFRTTWRELAQAALARRVTNVLGL